MFYKEKTIIKIFDLVTHVKYLITITFNKHVSWNKCFYLIKWLLMSMKGKKKKLTKANSIKL
jgi:ferric iron reductase protein FhuF